MTQLNTAENDQATPAPDGAPDRTVIMRLMFGAWLQQALYVVAKLDVADALAAGPKEIDALAGEVGADTQALARFMRALVSASVFEEPEPGWFALNGPARYLRSDVEDSHKYVAVLHGEEAYAAGAAALHTVRTGQPSFEKIYGKPYFQYLADNSEARSVFDAAMGRRTTVPLVVADCDFGTKGLLVDLGGGIGELVAAVLRDRPGLRGLIFDLPGVAAEAEANVRRLGLGERVKVAAGSAFDSVPAGGDVYTISRVLHDFNDERTLAVLRNVRAAISPTGRLLIFDALLPDRPGFNPGRLADLGMLMVLGGRYRTQSELSGLVTRAGFRIKRVAHAPRGADPRAESVIEAIPG